MNVNVPNNPKIMNKCADMFAALGEPHRIQIINFLRSGSRNVTELAKLLKIEIVNVSHHLSVLRSSGLVHDEKRGRFVIYSLHPDYFKTEKNKPTLLELGWCRVEIPHI
jgi:ArsR family transcriptional regulator, nickel/cobalt-responsive transcriptional repressor